MKIVSFILAAVVATAGCGSGEDASRPASFAANVSKLDSITSDGGVNPPPPDALPANDDFNSAQVAPSLPFTASLSTVAATTSADDPDCVGTGPTVWFAFTP